MQIVLCAIGKAKAGPHLALFDHYCARLPWKIRLKEWELKKPLSGSQRKAQEGAWLLEAASGCDHLVALDETGQQMTSAAFSSHLGRQRDQAVRSVAFIIGGADGLDAAVLARAHLTLSFGRMTWPHMLVRALLAEQLYRAHTISTGHPYHRE